MKTALFATVALFALSIGTHAGELSCRIQDTAGSQMTYIFSPNTAVSSHSGTFVETGFEKNGRMIISEVGQRPVWIWADDASGGYYLSSIANPGWFINVDARGSAMLIHQSLGAGRRFAGSGLCQVRTDNIVRDQGLGLDAHAESSTKKGPPSHRGPARHHRESKALAQDR